MISNIIQHQMHVLRVYDWNFIFPTGEEDMGKVLLLTLGAGTNFGLASPDWEETIPVPVLLNSRAQVLKSEVCASLLPWVFMIWPSLVFLWGRSRMDVERSPAIALDNSEDLSQSWGEGSLKPHRPRASALSVLLRTMLNRCKYPRWPFSWPQLLSPHRLQHSAS